MCPWHFVLPARLCAGSAASRKLSELGVGGVFAPLFDQEACFPKSDSPRRARTPKVPRLRDKTQRTKFAQARHGEFDLWRTAKTFIDSASQLPQLGGFFIAAFELEHHALDVSVVLVPPQELQALLRIAPLQDFDRLLTCAPGIHLVLVGHVKVDRVAPGRRPPVIFYAVTLSGGKQTKYRASRPPRPICRGTADLRRSRHRHRYSALHASRSFRCVFRHMRNRSRFFHCERLKLWRMRSGLVRW